MMIVRAALGRCGRGCWVRGANRTRGIWRAWAGVPNTKGPEPGFEALNPNGYGLRSGLVSELVVQADRDHVEMARQG
jgi:hypothetical protein